MLASSSRTLIKPLTSASRGFSTTAHCAARRETFVELLQDVPGLGRTFDRLFVAPGRARNDLVPSRQARFVAFKDNSRRQVYRATDEVRASRIALQIEAPNGQTPQQRAAPEEITVTPQDLLDTLHLLPSSLVFPRRTVSPDYPALHGSLTLSDVQERLSAEYGLIPQDAEVVWIGEEAGARMKEVGRRAAVVRLRKGGKEEVAVDIEVVREEQ